MPSMPSRQISSSVATDIGSASVIQRINAADMIPMADTDCLDNEPSAGNNAKSTTKNVARIKPISCFLAIVHHLKNCLRKGITRVINEGVASCDAFSS